jgi:hypothetical protein
VGADVGRFLSLAGPRPDNHVSRKATQKYSLESNGRGSQLGRGWCDVEAGVGCEATFEMRAYWPSVMAGERGRGEVRTCDVDQSGEGSSHATGATDT